MFKPRLRKNVLAGLLGLAGVVQADDFQTVKPEDTGAALINPTPEWVKNAGAKGYYYVFNKGRVKKSGNWDPDFDDPVFIRKLDAFLAAAARRYDGNPNVDFIDVGTYGMWGEGHTFMSSRQDTLESQKLHIDLHLKHFKKTRLCISDDFAGHNLPGKRFHKM